MVALKAESLAAFQVLEGQEDFQVLEDLLVLVDPEAQPAMTTDQLSRRLTKCLAFFFRRYTFFCQRLLAMSSCDRLLSC